MEKRKVSKRRQTGTTAKDDIEESYRMKLVAKDAVVIVSYFNNVNHEYWMKRLHG
ncbi:14100_t:CDS:2 [Entrophospora sp. SA101]|nr:14100_t:CDS:2 [Entrophospora sp. SA101]